MTNLTAIPKKKSLTPYEDVISFSLYFNNQESYFYKPKKKTGKVSLADLVDQIATPKKGYNEHIDSTEIDSIYDQ